LTGSIPGFVGEEGTDWCAKYLTANEARIFREKYQESRKETHGGYLNQTVLLIGFLKIWGTASSKEFIRLLELVAGKIPFKERGGDFDEDGRPGSCGRQTTGRLIIFFAMMGKRVSLISPLKLAWT
jgi:hypothetical protein